MLYDTGIFLKLDSKLLNKLKGLAKREGISVQQAVREGAQIRLESGRSLGAVLANLQATLAELKGVARQ